jgi:hypothetical protein
MKKKTTLAVFLQFHRTVMVFVNPYRNHQSTHLGTQLSSVFTLLLFVLFKEHPKHRNRAVLMVAIHASKAAVFGVLIIHF